MLHLNQLRKQANEFLIDLLRETVERSEIREDLDVERPPFLLNALLETLLSSYYTEFLASGLGLYCGNAAELDRWVATTMELVRRGAEKQG
jgi:hypothetical protein